MDNGTRRVALFSFDVRLFWAHQVGRPELHNPEKDAAVARRYLIPQQQMSDSAYSYRESLIRLSEWTPIKASVARVVAGEWRRSSLEPTGIMDFGGGDGKMLDHILRLAKVGHGVPIVFLERDSQFRLAASKLLTRSGFQVQPVESLEEVHCSPSHILASHVVYYVGDTGAWISQLSKVAAESSVLCLVARSTRCESRLLRDIVRNHYGIIARFSPESLAQDLLDYWSIVNLSAVSATLDLPPTLPLGFKSVTGDPERELELFVRWVSRLRPEEEVPPSVQVAINGFLAERLTPANRLHLKLVDVIVSAFR